MNTKPTAPRMNCEQLEARDNPAGNVTAFVSGGSVFLIGDFLDNQVHLQRDASGNLFAIGFPGTTVNGQSSVFLGNGIPNDVHIDMGAGNDHAGVDGLVAFGHLVILDGEGHDGASVTNTSVGRSIQIYGQGGFDNTFVSNVSARFIWLDSGVGIDAIHVDNAFAPGGVFVWNAEIPY
jgi:hypothetical protein